MEKPFPLADNRKRFRICINNPKIRKRIGSSREPILFIYDRYVYNRYPDHIRRTAFT